MNGRKINTSIQLREMLYTNSQAFLMLSFLPLHRAITTDVKMPTPVPDIMDRCVCMYVCMYVYTSIYIFLGLVSFLLHWGIWNKNSVCICHIRPPLWSSGQRPGLDSWRYKIFWEVVDLERGLLSLVSKSKELLERNSSCFGIERREYGRKYPSHWPRVNLYMWKLVLTSPTSGGRSVSIVRLQTQATEFFFHILDSNYVFFECHTTHFSF
jgi:hypothetical protein